MNINESKDALRACYAANLPMFMSGAPGLGKSESTYQLADELTVETNIKHGVIEFRGSTADPSEAGDMKWIVTEDGETHVVNVPQAWVPTEEAIAKVMRILALDRRLSGGSSDRKRDRNATGTKQLNLYTTRACVHGLPVVLAVNRHSDGAVNFNRHACAIALCY